MKRKLENKLFKKYPTLFPNGRNVNPMESLLCFGFECGDGWFLLIDELCGKITKLSKKTIAVQVKEKFGGLRFYVDFGDKKIWKLIEEYEKKSYKTCEYCGKKGKLRNLHGWYSTQCDKCLKKENENKNK